MATINPSNLYTGGAVVFNTQPTTNFAIQLLQQRKAKDDALEEYYRKLPATINEAGMRDQDRPGFMQSVQGLQQYWQQNREAIKNPRLDGGAAQYNYEKLFRDTRGIVEASKGAAKIDLELGKRKFDPNSQYIFEDPDIIQTVARHHLPVTDPNHQTADLYTLATPPKPMEQKDWDDYWRAVPGQLKPSQAITYKQDPNDQFSRIPVVTSSYSKEQLQQIGLNSAEAYQSNKRLRRSFDQSHGLLNIRDLSDWKEDHDKLYTQLNTTFRQVYGKDIESPAELHAAEAIQRFAPPQVEEKPAVPDWKARQDYDFGQQVALKRIPQATEGKKEGSATGPVGNVLNTIQVPANVVSGEFDMGRDGNKQNLAAIQQLLGDQVMPLSAINGQNANDPKNKVTYKVENGQVVGIKFRGLWYDRSHFERQQKQLDKNPQWEGKLRYPTEQQKGGHYTDPKGKKTQPKNNDPLGLGL